MAQTLLSGLTVGVEFVRNLSQAKSNKTVGVTIERQQCTKWFKGVHNTHILILNSLESYPQILTECSYRTWFNWDSWYNCNTSSKKRRDMNRFSTQPQCYSGNVQGAFFTKKVEATARSMSCSRRKCSSG